MSFLPLAHIMERIILSFLWSRGARVGFYQGVRARVRGAYGSDGVCGGRTWPRWWRTRWPLGRRCSAACPACTTGMRRARSLAVRRAGGLTVSQDLRQGDERREGGGRRQALAVQHRVQRQAGRHQGWFVSRCFCFCIFLSSWLMLWVQGAARRSGTGWSSTRSATRSWARTCGCSSAAAPRCRPPCRTFCACTSLVPPAYTPEADRERTGCLAPRCTRVTA
jgi:hypothetical protein